MKYLMTLSMKYLMTLSGLGLMITLLLSMASHAIEKKPYSDALFNELSATNDVVIIDIHADWCPTCARQQKILARYLLANPDKPVHLLVVDFDTNKKAVKQFGARRQSTLIIFKSGVQQWFSVAETRPDVIAAKIDNALAL